MSAGLRGLAPEPLSMCVEPGEGMDVTANDESLYALPTQGEVFNPGMENVSRMARRGCTAELRSILPPLLGGRQRAPQTSLEGLWRLRQRTMPGRVVLARGGSARTLRWPRVLPAQLSGSDAPTQKFGGV